MNPAGIPAIHQGLFERFNHAVIVSKVSAASSWFDVPNKVQNTFQAGTTAPVASFTTHETLIAGSARVANVAATLPADCRRAAA